MAAEFADVVNVSVTVGAASVHKFDQCVDWVRSAAGSRFDSLELQILVSAVMTVESPRAATRSARMLGFSGDDALELPVLLIGTEAELCERLIERREKWGFSNIVVPGESLHTFAPVVSRLAGS